MSMFVDSYRSMLDREYGIGTLSSKYMQVQCFSASGGHPARNVHSLNLE